MRSFCKRLRISIVVARAALPIVVAAVVSLLDVELVHVGVVQNHLLVVLVNVSSDIPGCSKPAQNQSEHPHFGPNLESKWIDPKRLRTIVFRDVTACGD